MPDPLTLPLHDTAIVATAVITFAGIVRWFQAQRHLPGGNADASVSSSRGGWPAIPFTRSTPGSARAELTGVCRCFRVW